MTTNAVSAASATSATSAAGAAGGLNMQDLLKILLTQLNYQDPLKPMDNTQFVAQIAQFASLNETSQLNTSMQQSLSLQSSLEPVNLLGKSVTYNLGSGASDVSGTVSAISMQSGSPVFTITTSSGGQQTGVSLSEITGVQ